MGVITFTNMMLQTIGKVFPATLLSMGRQGIFYLPFVLTLPVMLGKVGIVIVQPVADLLTFALSLVLAIREIKDLNRRIKEQEAP